MEFQFVLVPDTDTAIAIAAAAHKLGQRIASCCILSAFRLPTLLTPLPEC